MRTIKLVGSVVLTCGLLWIGSVAAQDHDHSAHGDHDMLKKAEADKAMIEKGVTIKGHVIDIVCYTRHAAIGEKHLKCASTCANVGIPMGILEAGTNEIFLVFPPGHKNPNDQLMAFLEKDVTVNGTVHRKGGLKGITITKIAERSAH